MKIVVLGTRGIPNVQGGVETHCEALYPRLVRLGHHVTVITRKPYISQTLTEYQHVLLKHIWAPKLKSLEAIVHSVLGVFIAAAMRPDVLHIHAIGPSLAAPLARSLGLKVVITHHGADYDRQKWGTLAKMMLKLGESMAAKYAHQVISISQTIQLSLKSKFKRDSVLIYNGVNPPIKSVQTDYLQALGLSPQHYIVAVGRFVEEKGFHDLVAAFASLHEPICRLVLVGDADHKTSYSENLKCMAEANGVVLTGFIKGNKLNQIYSHARLFVLPSYHEGLPIALLEAMSYGIQALVSDIAANAEVRLPDGCYFKVGDIGDLSLKLKASLSTSIAMNYEVLLEKYDWDAIAEQTVRVYQSVVTG